MLIIFPLLLAVVPLVSPTSLDPAVHAVLDLPSPRHHHCQNIRPTGPIETTECDYESIESVNDNLFSDLAVLVRLPFFKYFQVDLYRECPFWSDHGQCKEPSCALTTIDESDIPERWRASALSKVDSPSIEQRHQLPGCYYRDADFCFLDDNTEGDYYDLSTIPERFTGYSGPDAHRIWRAIYDENCFGLSEMRLMSGKSPAPVPQFFANGNFIDHEEHCLEKRVYYKVISGLHASISTHICLDYLNQTTGQWAPNMTCFIDRVASHPERLQYIYFNTVLILRAVSRLGPYLSAFDYCSTGSHEDDKETLSIVKKVIDIANDVGKFDETVLFRGENAVILKEEFKTHFRNVSMIMDCVGCDKCRLWGKVQTIGLATAMKILFELDEKALNPHSNANLLQRSEVVALMNTLHRFAESIDGVNKFRMMWSKMNMAHAEKFIAETEKYIVTGKPMPSPSVGHQGEPLLDLIKRTQIHLASLLRGCEQGTKSCLGILWTYARSGLEYVGNLWKRIAASKSGTPHGDL